MKNLQVVLDSDLCVGCGACTAAEPGLKLHLHPEKLMYEPDGPGGERAASVCPAIQVDFAGLQQRLFPGKDPTSVGVVEGVYLAQSLNLGRNLRASSGGLIKELLLYYLSRDDVDGAIVLGHRGGLDYEPRLIRTAAEVDALPGSVYHSLSFEKAIRLLEENEGRFVVVAIPCQLEGLYQYVYKYRPELKERIFATIGLICGWTYSHHALRAISEFSRTNYDDLKDVTYRGGGPVGPLRLITSDVEKRVHRRINFGYQVAFDRSFNIPRCHLCIDHTNFLADIVVGDAWLPSTVGTKSGVSIVVCRRQETVEHLQELRNRQRIRLVEVGVDDVVESQSRRVAFGDFSYAYADYQRAQGRHVPDMVGPNRAAAKLRPESEVATFHRTNERKLRLQRARRYRALWRRKLTVEFWGYSYRYIRWFSIRVLKVKSLLGLRKEVPREKLQDFV